MDPWHIASAICSGVGAIVLAAIVLHPQIHEGLTVKAGLIVATLSLAGTALLTLSGSHDWSAYWRAGFSLRAGLALACVGILLRAHRLGRLARQRQQREQHRQATRRWLRSIAEPVHDLAYLFRDEGSVQRAAEREAVAAGTHRERT